MDSHERNSELMEYILSGLGNYEQTDEEVRRALEERGEEELWPMIEAYRMNCASQVRRFADEMPGGFFIYRADGNEDILYANDALLRIFGCDNMADFLAWTRNSFRGMVHPDDLDEVEKSIAEQIRESRYDLDYVEYRIIRRDGEIRWVDDYGHFIKYGEGGLFYVFIGDATEKRKRLAQERLIWQRESTQREEKWKSQAEVYSKELESISREHFRRLEVIEGLSIDYASILYVDLKEDRIRAYRLSEQFQTLFGEEKTLSGVRQCMESYISRWVHPEDQEMFRDSIAPDKVGKMLANRNAFQIHYRILVEGHEAYRQMYVVNVGSEAQVAQIVLGTRSVDNEVRHELEQRRVLEEALEQAKAANVAKNAFLANMSHDLRTPMNAIMGFAQLARQHRDDPEKVRGCMDGIEESGKLLLQLFSDVLEITKIESEQVRIEESEGDLEELVGKVCEDWRDIALTKKLSLSCSLSGIRHKNIYADMGKLGEVLTHLVRNALKYTEEGGNVWVTAEETKRLSDDYAIYRFIVEDTGIGIGADFIPHIFEPFEREKNTTMSGVQGTGLGLAITKNIVDRMGGTIEAASEPGKGSRFTVTLSFRLNHMHDKGRERRESTLDRLRRGQKILLVEDNEINREIEVELLRCAGFLVDTASDGNMAANAVRNSLPGEYALVLMDIQMPVVDGHQAARLIRSIPDPELSGIPIVALSANAFDEDRRQSIRSGMNAHMAKPVNMPRLIELLEEI